MTTCYIINGHPDKDSLNYANAEALKEAAEAQGHETLLIHANDFPRVATNPATHGGYPPEYAEISLALSTADYIAITVPMWNLGAPGVFKNFIDGAAQARVWFKYQAPTGLKKKMGLGAELVGLLKAKKVVVVWTSGGPTWVYKIFGNALIGQIKSMFKFYGAKSFDSLSLGQLNGPVEKQRKIAEPFLEKLKNYKF